MYQPGTILALKEQRTIKLKQKDDAGKEVEVDAPFPYNKVEVIGQSPVNHALLSSSWVGVEAQGVLLRPLEGFEANLDEPYGRVQELYDVESVPEAVSQPVAQQVKIVEPGQLGPSPEEVFKAEAKKNPPKAARRAAKRDPLGDK